MNPADCIHCGGEPDGECGRLCDRCPCLHCVTARDEPDTDAWCLPCVRWIGRFGSGVRATLAQVARDRGTTLAQARADLLSAFHRQHTKESADE